MKTRKNISVDLDQTLIYTELPDGEWIKKGICNLQPIKEVLGYLCERSLRNYDIHLISFRGEDDREEVQSFIQKYNIPIKSITLTNGSDKTPIMLSLRSELHIDDRIDILQKAQEKNIQGLLVCGGQHENNPDASKFEIIKVKYE